MDISNNRKLFEGIVRLYGEEYLLQLNPDDHIIGKIFNNRDFRQRLGYVSRALDFLFDNSKADKISKFRGAMTSAGKFSAKREHNFWSDFYELFIIGLLLGADIPISDFEVKRVIGQNKDIDIETEESPQNNIYIECNCSQISSKKVLSPLDEMQADLITMLKKKEDKYLAGDKNISACCMHSRLSLDDIEMEQLKNALKAELVKLIKTSAIWMAKVNGKPFMLVSKINTKLTDQDLSMLKEKLKIDIIYC
ncbi:MAG: hypothetical protein NT099_06175 [Candidatus Saganbacteria bacterium]|nr:hypothetical protein [Candidatus Saganbacteria bacterium]